MPTRPGKPRDKAKVETAELIALRWILACLRNRTFFASDELKAAIAELPERVNAQPFKKPNGCRRSAFEAVDRPAPTATVGALVTGAMEEGHREHRRSLRGCTASYPTADDLLAQHSDDDGWKGDAQSTAALYRSREPHHEEGRWICAGLRLPPTVNAAHQIIVAEAVKDQPPDVEHLVRDDRSDR